MPIFRPARENELGQIYEVYYQNELQDNPDLPPHGEISPDLEHTLQTGTISVAEQDGEIVAFAAAITRGDITFLTDLFVLPGQQSGQLGKALLHDVLPPDGLVHCTMSSTDPRALALYIRAGMRPMWPNFNLQLHRRLRNVSSSNVDADVDIVEGVPGDPELVVWDAEISGRPRPGDHAHWVRMQQGVPLWFERQGQRIGYGYVRPGVSTFLNPQACKVGPIGVRAAEDATACVLAAVRWASQQAEVLHIDVPGPHPCLATLLAQGFYIIYVETFLSTADAPFFDAQHYIASGSNLL